MLDSASRPNAVRAITIATAASDRHLEQMLALQQRNLRGALPREQQDAEGFVFVQHTLALLRRMAAELPQAIALHEDRVVAYCLALAPALKAQIPHLQPMFEQFDRSLFRGRPLSDYRYMVGGQVCVDRDFRGQGLLARLYRHIAASLPPGYELCVTEVASRNQVSLRAHERMGFEALSTYAADGEEWIVVAWDLSR